MKVVPLLLPAMLPMMFVNVELPLRVKVMPRLMPVMLPVMFVNAADMLHALEEKIALLECGKRWATASQSISKTVGGFNAHGNDSDALQGDFGT